MSDEIDDRPVLSRADRALLKSAHAPTDAQISASRLALAARLAALTAGGALTSVASSAEAGSAATTAATAATSTATAATGAVTATTVAKTAGLLGAAKWFAAGVLVSAVAGGAVLATKHSAREERTAASGEHGPQAHEAQVVAAPAPVLQATPQPAAPVEVVAQVAAVEAEPIAKPVSAARRITRRERDRPALPGETLAEELSLLRNARQALERGDARAALRELDAHAARYSRPVLRQEALAARALALCAADRTSDARRAAAQLARIAPRSPHLIGLADSCALEDGE